MKPMRGEGAAAVCARAVPAGIIASSSGSAIVTPAPRRKVRRDKCFFVMNMCFLLLGLRVLEWCALHDSHNDRRKAVIVFRRIAHDFADCRHIVVLDISTKGVSHQLF